MFSRLVQKELLNHLLDFRFLAVFALCALLSVLSVYVGNRNFALQLREYNATSESNWAPVQKRLDSANIYQFEVKGYYWNRRPEVLSPIVYGLSGTQGQVVSIQYRRPPKLESSLFETDPIHALFGVLDLAFIVKFILSLAVLLFTYDTVCGEKEGGTLRLYASFPVPRSTLALAKLAGSTVAVLVPFLFAYLLAVSVLALSPDLGLQGEDWGRLAVLMGLFALYLAVFSAFGLCVSALTHRRMTAFLVLLALWTVWIFLVPNLAVRAAQRVVPVESVYDFQKRSMALRFEIKGERVDEIDAHWERQNIEDWDAVPEARKEELLHEHREIQSKWDGEYATRVDRLQSDRRNRTRRQQRLALVLSAISPFSTVNFVSMDLARTGLVQQERIEDAVKAHLIYLAGFIREKHSQLFQKRVMTDFSPFTYRDTETLGDCLARNVFHIANLALLAVLGFAGAYVAILRYDVR